MALINGRKTYKPFSYGRAFDYWLQQQQAHWLATEVSLNSDLMDWKENLTEAEKSVIGGILKGFTQSEIVVGDYWTNKVAKWFPHPEVVMAATTMGAFECFDDKTELLTSSGWKSVVDITSTDKIAQYDLFTKSISFSLPKKVVSYDYNGIMHHYASKGTDICVTPNHDLIVIHPKTKKAKKCKSENGTWGNNYQYPSSGYSAIESEGLTDYEKLLILIQADGCLYGACPGEKDNRRDCSINLSKPRKIEKLENILKSLNIKFTKSSKGWFDSLEQFCYNFSIPGEVAIKSIKNFDCFSLENFSAEKAKAFIEELIFWDGTGIITKKKGAYWYNTNKEAVDKVHAICILSGYSSVVGINRTKEQSLNVQLPNGKNPATSKDCYVLSFSARKDRTYPYRKKISYSGKVYCVSVPTENLVSRRNGRVAITGNTIHVHGYSLLDESLGFQDYETYIEEPTIKAKLERLVNTSGETKEDIARSLAIFSAFMEGVSLFSSFAVLMSFSRYNKLKGVAQIVSWSVRDEALHSEFGCWLFKQFIAENPKIWTDEFKKTIYQAARDTVELEDNFIDMVFSKGDVEGLTAYDLKQFIRNRANVKLGDLGLKQNWKNIDKDALKRMEWFDYLSAGVRHDDFFAVKVADYSKSLTFDDDMF